MADLPLRIVPLGGLGEFGMNCMALCYGEDIIVLDAGMMFPEDELLGVDSVIPDWSWLEERREQVRALFLTHGHEDHIGAVPFFISEFPSVPIYGTAFTLALSERKLDEHDLMGEAKLNVVAYNQMVEAGPFQVEFIRVTHSIVQAAALAITTPAGVVIHTGDFKVDPTPTDNELFDLHSFAEYGKRGVLLLMSDSTNADRPGYTPSERAVRPRLEEIISRAEHRVVVSSFSTSIHRMQQIIDLSWEYGRKVGLLGRSMLEVTEIAHNLGLLTIPDNLLLRPQDIMQAARSKVTVLLSGTQGEPMSAMSRVAVDNHRHLSVAAGDTVVLSARMIPGNEKAIYRMINHYARRGAELVYGNMTPPVHVSGHASAEECKLLLNLLRPKYFMPVHGEYRQMSIHASHAQHMRMNGVEESFILETGETLEISKDGARKGPKVPVGRVCIDSGSIDEFVDDIVIRDRRHLSEDGFVLPIIAINKHSGKAEGLPEIVSRGFMSKMENGADLMQNARQVVAKTLESSSPEERGDWGVMQEKIRADLKRYISKQTSRRPLIMPVILEV